MSASFAINQPTGAGAGTVGVARDDLWQGQRVYLRCPDTHSEYSWSFLDAPPGTAATIHNPTSQEAYFDPDEANSYRVQLVVDGGGSGNVSVKIAAVSKSSIGAEINRGWRLPAYDERPGENNFEGNARGHAPAMEKIINDLRENAFSGGGGSLVYKPGTTTSGNVYGTWVEVMAAFATSSGIVTIVIDDTETSPAPIPAGSWDMQDRAYLVGYLQSASPRADLQFASGCVLSNPAGFSFLNVRSVSESAAIVGVGSSPLTFTADHVLFEQTAGAGVLIEAPPTGCHIEMRGDSEFTRSTGGPILQCGADCLVQLDEFASIESNTVSGGESSDLTIRLSTSIASASSTQTDFDGTLVIEPAPDTTSTLLFQPGGVSQRNIYTTWGSLMTSFGVNTAGEATISMDKTYADVVIPSGSYSFEARAIFAGPYLPASGGVGGANLVPVRLDHGVLLNGVGCFKNLVINSYANEGADPPVSSPVLMLDNCFLGQYGTGNVPAVISSRNIWLRNGTVVMGGSHPKVLVSGTSTIILEDVSAIANNMIVGSGTLHVYLGSCAASFGMVQENFTGTLVVHFPVPPVYTKDYVFTGGENTTINGSGSPLVMGAIYFDAKDIVPATDGRTRTVKFKVIIETTNASYSANVELYDVNGITNGGTPTLIASSALSTTQLSPTYLEVDISAALGSVTANGILECWLWLDPTNGVDAATCKMAKVEVSWGSTGTIT